MINSRVKIATLLISFLLVFGVVFVIYILEPNSMFGGDNKVRIDADGRALTSKVSVLDSGFSNENGIYSSNTGTIVQLNVVTNAKNIKFSFQLQLESGEPEISKKNFIIYDDLVDVINVYNQKGDIIDVTELRVGDRVKVDYKFSVSDKKYSFYNITLLK